MSALGPATVEIGTATVDSATAESFMVINVSIGGETASVETATAERTETTTES
ncbi:hypothetical protein [Halomicrococcus sp. NG-SE-24]|uniref:hypothetical protein n=1 Tax=Halomicrococcus sp. NG-SE-24 TaxID=3436928 RepID=UPI003D9656DE